MWQGPIERQQFNRNSKKDSNGLMEGGFVQEFMRWHFNSSNVKVLEVLRFFAKVLVTVRSEGKSFTTITNPQSGFKEVLDMPKAASHVLKEYAFAAMEKRQPAYFWGPHTS